MIELRGVALDRGARTVLDGLDLSLREQRIGVVGSNGSGKSSFVRLLNGLLLPSRGSVEVFGLDTTTDTKAVRRSVGFLFQNPDHQIVYPAVAEDLGFGLRNRGVPKADIAARIEMTLDRLSLQGFGNRLAHELSGGERQLVALAGILVLEPRLLVLDEPTTLLDRRNTRRVMAAVASAGRPIVMVTHDLDLLSDFDRVLVFDEGRLVCDAAPREALDAYRRWADA